MLDGTASRDVTDSRKNNPTFELHLMEILRPWLVYPFRDFQFLTNCDAREYDRRALACRMTLGSGFHCPFVFWRIPRVLAGLYEFVIQIGNSLDVRSVPSYCLFLGHVSLDHKKQIIIVLSNSSRRISPATSSQSYRQLDPSRLLPWIW